MVKLTDAEKLARSVKTAHFATLVFVVIGLWAYLEFVEPRREAKEFIQGRVGPAVQTWVVQSAHQNVSPAIFTGLFHTWN